MFSTNSYSYWMKYLLLPPTQLTAAALVLQYWVSADRVSPGVWITVFLIVIIAINLFGVQVFGELEFYLSAVKVIIVVGLLILSLVITCGGGPDHETRGFKYWSNPGAFNHFIQGECIRSFAATF